jgi:alpha/beta superfamily hydrolase
LNTHTEKYLIDGPVGPIEVALDHPPASHETPVRGIALVAHPHPLLGGTMDNKVAQTLARTFTQLGYVTIRSNFRGVGKTAGSHDEGLGERDDLLAVIDHLRAHAPFANAPLVLGGFSFGTFVLSHIAKRLEQANTPAQRLVFVGTATSRWDVANVPDNTLVIHGEEDDTVPLKTVFDWARPMNLPIIVIPGADHFFHKKLVLLKQIITDAWRV